MKAQNTTPIMTRARDHQGAIALAVLITLLVIGLALQYTPSLISRTAPDTTVRPVAKQLIATCRVCRDEALGAVQSSLATVDFAQPVAPLVDQRQSGPR